MANAIRIKVNGKYHESTAAPETPLLFVLRDEIGLTGTKYGCGEGQCGACTVMLDGLARRSCQIPVASVGTRAVLTIEGLECDGQLHPVQQAFLDEGAFQCAYCTSGMIISCVDLLNRNSNPSESEIVRGLQGNICRCGTHPRIIRAVQNAAAKMSEHQRE
jgi:aerobic-type carbon monoxide dehydrogenase small subunit (CoxS/CutS family)